MQSAAYWGAVCGLLAFVADPAPSEGRGRPVKQLPTTRSPRVAPDAPPRADELAGLFDPDIDGSREEWCSASTLSFIDIAHSHQPLRWAREAATATCWCSWRDLQLLELRDELAASTARFARR